jgi:hypothetical protein
MARIVLRGDPTEAELKHIVPLDPYYRIVDDKFHKEIVDFTNRQDGQIIPYHLDFGVDSDNLYRPIAQIRDFHIYGRALIRGGMYLHAENLAQHGSLPVNE